MNESPPAHQGLRLPPSFGVCEADARTQILTFLDEHRATLDGYDQACERSRTAVAEHELTDVITGHRFGPMTLHWIVLHCIRETAQHVGHADILRQQIIEQRP